jgi:hypothetical protein
VNIWEVLKLPGRNWERKRVVGWLTARTASGELGRNVNVALVSPHTEVIYLLLTAASGSKYYSCTPFLSLRKFR